MFGDIGVMDRLKKWEEGRGESIGTRIEGVFYQDGAWREFEPVGRWMVASDFDAFKRTRNIMRFHELKLARATEEFNERKDQLASRATAVARDGGTMPGEAEIAALKRLQSCVRKLRKEFNAARDAHEAAKPPALRNMEVMRAENQTRRDSFMAELDQIRV